MKIEPANLEDAQSIAEIHVSSWQEAYKDLLPAAYLATLSVDKRKAMWVKIISEEQSSLLTAKENGETLGWISFGLASDSNSKPTDSELYAIYVSPPHWGRGVGRALWTHTKIQLKNAGYQTCCLWVLKGNHRAINFYISEGFSITDAKKGLEIIGQHFVEEKFACPV